jgi:hypothetical protein
MVDRYNISDESTASILPEEEETHSSKTLILIHKTTGHHGPADNVSETEISQNMKYQTKC